MFDWIFNDFGTEISEFEKSLNLIMNDATIRRRLLNGEIMCICGEPIAKKKNVLEKLADVGVKVVNTENEEDALFDEFMTEQQQVMGEMVGSIDNAIKEIREQDLNSMSDFANWLEDELIAAFKERVIKIEYDDDGKLMCSINDDLFEGVLFGARLMHYLMDGSFDDVKGLEY